MITIQGPLISLTNTIQMVLLIFYNLYKVISKIYISNKPEYDMLSRHKNSWTKVRDLIRNIPKSFVSSLRGNKSKYQFR
jgi:hypothetical protein